MDEAKSAVAMFTQSAGARLTINAKVRNPNECGPSNGIVISQPAGVNCQNDQFETSCISTFPLGTQVTLTGTPRHPLSAFEGFSGACSGKPTCIFTITGDTTVVATFCGSIP
jgi:hypothetical protein